MQPPCLFLNQNLWELDPGTDIVFFFLKQDQIHATQAGLKPCYFSLPSTRIMNMFPCTSFGTGIWKPIPCMIYTYFEL